MLKELTRIKPKTSRKRHLPDGRKPARILFQPKGRKSYPKAVGAMFERMGSMPQNSYAVRGEQAQEVHADSGSSDDEPPPPPAIYLEEERRQDSADLEFYVLQEAEQIVPEDTFQDYCAATGYYHPERDEGEEPGETPFAAMDDWHEMMLRREYAGLPTTYLPDEMLMGAAKPPQNINDLLDKIVERIMDL